MNTSQIYEMNRDAFLFQVQESYDARLSANRRQFLSHLRYEPFLEGDFNAMEPYKNVAAFKNSLRAMVEHHKNILPQYRNQDSVNLETVSWFTLSLSTFVADLAEIYFLAFGGPLPLLAKSELPRKNSSHMLSLALKKFLENRTEENFQLFPLCDENDVDVTIEFVEEFWSFVWYVIRQNFGKYAPLFQDYFLWKFVAKPVDEKPEVDWNIQPPCGDAYYKAFKPLFDTRDKPGFRDRRGGNSSASRPQSFDRTSTNVRPKNQENSDKNDRYGAQKDRSQSFVSRRDVEKQDGFSRSSGPRHRGPQRENNHANTQTLEKALQEVRDGIETLKSKSDLKSLALKPQNSFVRRQQHVLITEQGYETESIGQGDHRCVSILNK